MDDGWGGVPADAFVAILLRIPPAPRRRLRLVCRHWRDTIDERTPEPRTGAKVLVFSMGWVGNLSRAHVLDELTRGGRGRELDLWHDADTRMIGTCNGLLCCFRRNREDLAVTNPVTGETIAVDLPPTWWYCRAQPTSYSFGYHPATGQYKIVHVRSVRRVR